MKRFCSTLSHKKHMSIRMRKSKHPSRLKSLILKVKPKKKKKNLPTYLVPPTHLNVVFNLF